jgi:hypothetical protein
MAAIIPGCRAARNRAQTSTLKELQNNNPDPHSFSIIFTPGGTPGPTTWFWSIAPFSP